MNPTAESRYLEVLQAISELPTWDGKLVTLEDVIEWAKNALEERERTVRAARLTMEREISRLRGQNQTLRMALAERVSYHPTGCDCAGCAALKRYSGSLTEGMHLRDADAIQTAVCDRFLVWHRENAEWVCGDEYLGGEEA